VSQPIGAILPIPFSLCKIGSGSVHRIPQNLRLRGGEQPTRTAAANRAGGGWVGKRVGIAVEYERKVDEPALRRPGNGWYSSP